MGVVTLFLIVSSLQDVYAVTCSEPQLSMCDCDGKSIQCISKGLDAFPKNIPSDTMSLNLDGNSITAIDANSLSGLTSLEQLDVNANSISNIATDAFNDLVSLRLIALNSNSLTSLPEGLFLSNPNLEVVSIQRNMLTTISANIFGTTTKIYFLGLAENSLKCCKMIDLFEWTSNQTDLTSLSGTCFDFNTTQFIDVFNTSKCPVDGQWGSWSNQTCSVTCGNGIGSRNRTCESAEPSEDGKDCVGSRIETLMCNLKNCAVDGQWGSWSNLTCSVTCGNGRGSRNRTCDSPEPSVNGKDCVGPRMETSLCNVQNCPRKCKKSGQNQDGEK